VFLLGPDGHGDEKLGGHARSGQGGVVRVRRKRCDLVRTPDPQRHAGQNLLELVAVAGSEQPKGAPLAWLERRPPEAKQVALRRQLGRVGCFACPNVLDSLLGRAAGHVRGHRDEVFHEPLPADDPALASSGLLQCDPCYGARRYGVRPSLDGSRGCHPGWRLQSRVRQLPDR
jgi:hypothetical protein